MISTVTNGQATGIPLGWNPPDSIGAYQPMEQAVSAINADERQGCLELCGFAPPEPQPAGGGFTPAGFWAPQSSIAIFAGYKSQLCKSFSQIP
jgi:hypothetical protein